MVSTLLLHSEGICGLCVEVCSILVLVGSAAEEGEASTGALGCFVCLVLLEKGINAWDRVFSNLLQQCSRVLRHDQ